MLIFLGEGTFATGIAAIAASHGFVDLVDLVLFLLLLASLVLCFPFLVTTFANSMPAKAPVAGRSALGWAANIVAIYIGLAVGLEFVHGDIAPFVLLTGAGLLILGVLLPRSATP